MKTSAWQDVRASGALNNADTDRKGKEDESLEDQVEASACRDYLEARLRVAKTRSITQPKTQANLKIGRTALTVGSLQER